MLEEKIYQDYVAALKAKDKLRVDFLSFIRESMLLKFIIKLGILARDILELSQLKLMKMYNSSRFIVPGKEMFISIIMINMAEG